MRQLRPFGRRLSACLLAAVCWLSTVAEVWAQQQDSPSVGGRSASPWVLPYALAIFAVGLGLLIVCKPSRRREKAKVEQ